MKTIKKLWKDSASLIILVKKNITDSLSKYNYDVLTFKRSTNTEFMKKHIVFPGGATDKIDEIDDWIGLYNKLGIKADKLNKLSDDVIGPRHFIFQKSNLNSINKEISLRITAIRETFEEMGILICKTKDEFRNQDLFSKYYNKLDDVQKWQKLVHNDSTQFYEMCKMYEIAPDLWGMYEWSSWLTPTVAGPKRYETVFFMVALEDLPKIHAEEYEVDTWYTYDAEKLINAHRLSELWLPPPQLYELLRIRKYLTVESLIKFAEERNKKGLTLLYPYIYQTSDKFVQVLPGDDLYPSKPDFNDVNDIGKFSEITANELRKKAKNLHRIEYEAQNIYKIYMNIKPLDGHVSPLDENEDNSNILKNKL